MCRIMYIQKGSDGIARCKRINVQWECADMARYVNWNRIYLIETDRLIPQFIFLFQQSIRFRYKHDEQLKNFAGLKQRIAATGC